MVDHESNQRGVIPVEQALQIARQAGLDLVEVAPNERPPVCRIMDYGKFKYQQSKRKQVHHPEQSLKEVRLRPKTDKHDRAIKLKRARDFLAKGHKVQFTVMFRGRERFHREIGFDIFNGVVEELGDWVKVEQAPRHEGRRLVMILAPTKAAKAHGEAAEAASKDQPKAESAPSPPAAESSSPPAAAADAPADAPAAPAGA